MIQVPARPLIWREGYTPAHFYQNVGDPNFS
jgi:hypothetical protein